MSVIDGNVDKWVNVNVVWCVYVCVLNNKMSGLMCYVIYYKLVCGGRSLMCMVFRLKEGGMWYVVGVSIGCDIVVGLMKGV